MKYFLLLFGIFLTELVLNAQTLNDSVMVNERKIDRPLTLHRGQLQFNPGYEISIITKEFDNNSTSISLAEKGTASVLHKYFFELNYGIFDFFQASLALNYAQRGARHEPEYIYLENLDNPEVEITWFDDYYGFEDFYAGAVIKLPLKSKKIEIALSQGICFPLFSNNPPAPENIISFPSENYPVTTIIYHTNHKIGNGAKAIKIGASAIMRPFSVFSISAKVNYSSPLSESESIRWMHYLNGSDFVYKDVPYKYLIANTFDYSLNLAYQAIPWFNVNLSVFHKKSSSGWSEITGFRIGNLETGLSLLSLGYEIKATSKLWITEFIDVSLAGKNQLAPYSIFLGISYNLFPADRKLKQGKNNKTID